MTFAETVRRIQFILIESASCSADQLFAAGTLLSRPDYDDVVVERSIAGLCGYPPCPNYLPVERDRRGQFRISLREHRVYDLSETFNYCCEACVVRSRIFSTSLNAERVSDLNEVKIGQILRLFGDWNVGGVELEEEGDLGINSLIIKEKVDAGAGEVPFDEWIGPANAIEGFVPQRDRSRDSGSNFIPQHTTGEIEMPFSSGIFVANDTLELKLPKSSLKTSGSKAGSHSVKWADEENLLLEDKKIIPQESSKEDFDSSERFTSAEACATALIQAAESVASGKTEVGEAISEAGILILPQSQSLHDEEEVDDDIYKLGQDIVKWPKKTVLLDTDVFEVQDSWHDTAPEGFSLNLSPFATMWMTLFGWVNRSSLAYIYGCDESSLQNFMPINGKDYPQKVTLRDGKSLEIRKALDGFICRTLPVLVKDQRLPVPVSTVERFMGCLLDTMSFMDAIPSFKIRQWHVVIFLFIEALSVYRLPVMASHLKSRGIPLQQMLNSAQFSSEEYEVMRDLLLPFGRSTEFSI